MATKILRRCLTLIWLMPAMVAANAQTAAGASAVADPLYPADRVAAVAPFESAAFAKTFSHRKISINGVTVHFVEGGRGPAIVLLHGWPETWYSWRRVMPALAASHRVIAVDMPGFGDSDQAPSADKRSIAQIIHGLMTALELGPATVVGHDMGGPVAYALSATQGQSVAKLVMIETAVPGFGFADGSAQDILNPTPQSVNGIWHFAFFMKPGMPEMLIAGNEQRFLWAMVKDSLTNPEAFSKDELDELTRWLSAPGGISGGLAYYRTLYTDAVDNKVLGQKKLEMPVLVINGGDGFLQYVSPQSMMAVAEDVSVQVAPVSGHFIAIERPSWLANSIRAFADLPVRK